MKFEVDKRRPMKNLRNLRLAKGWSIEELAERSGTATYSIEAYEQGIWNADTYVGYTCDACNFGAAFGMIDLEDLLVDVNEPKEEGIKKPLIYRDYTCKYCGGFVDPKWQECNCCGMPTKEKGDD